MKPIEMKLKGGVSIKVHPAQVATYEGRGYSIVTNLKPIIKEKAAIKEVIKNGIS